MDTRGSRYGITKKHRFAMRTDPVYVHQISIVEHERGQGYGMKLLEAIYDIAKANGIEKIELDYWSDNEAPSIFIKSTGLSSSAHLCINLLDNGR